MKEKEERETEERYKGKEIVENWFHLPDYNNQEELIWKLNRDFLNTSTWNCGVPLLNSEWKELSNAIKNPENDISPMVIYGKSFKII